MTHTYQWVVATDHGNHRNHIYTDGLREAVELCVKLRKTQPELDPRIIRIG